MIPKLIVEFIGTFFLCLAASLSGGGGPFAAGLILATMIYAGGHVSGGHYNPAVTAAVYFRGKIALPEAIQYVAAQFAAAVAAVIVGLICNAKSGPEAELARLASEQAGEFLHKGFTTLKFFQNLTGELLGTFALTYVVLNVATTRKLEGNPFYGAAIGLTVTAMAFAFGQAFNPAVALVLALLQKAHFTVIFTCLVGAAVAAFGSAFVVNLLQNDGPQKPPAPPQPDAPQA